MNKEVQIQLFTYVRKIERRFREIKVVKTKA